MIIDKLIGRIVELQNPVCVGLDTIVDYLPQEMKAEIVDYRTAAEQILIFNRKIVDSVCDIVPAVKIQIACYEMYGAAGIDCFEKTVKYAEEKGLIVIADGKRNDIGNTAGAYAKAFLGKTQLFGHAESASPVDCVTVNPYLGIDGVDPFIREAVFADKSIFILVKTSNKSSGDFQDLDMDGQTLYRRVGEKVEEWGAAYIGESGYSPCGAVVGATYPAQLTELRAALPHTFFLIPGYGAQGGAAKDIDGAFDKNGLGAIVNSSRALMCAYKKAGDDGTNLAKHTRDAVIAMRDDINSVRGAR